MIALGNNIYRTLDDKFYLGTQQIGKVYLGENLIYPKEKIIIGGIDIDTTYHSMDGNMFDLGYSPTKNTRFEFCFIPDNINDSMSLFGTQHDDKCDGRYTYLLTGDNKDTRELSPIGGNPKSSNYRTHNVNVKPNNTNTYTTIVKDTSSNSTWSTSYVGTNGYTNYNAGTLFSLIKGRNLFSFRYGGSQHTSEGENTISENMYARKSYVVGLDDLDSTKKWYAFSGYYGKYYYVLNNKAVDANVSNKINKKKASLGASFSNSSSGGNIWLNSINARIPNPNVRRPYDTTNHTFDDDLIYYNNTTNAGFVYMIIWESGGAKTLYTQNYDANRTPRLLINKYVQVSDGQGGYKFNDPDPNTGKVVPDEIIYPFYRCIPV